MEISEVAAMMEKHKEKSVEMQSPEMEIPVMIPEQLEPESEQMRLSPISIMVTPFEDSSKHRFKSNELSKNGKGKETLQTYGPKVVVDIINKRKKPIEGNDIVPFKRVKKKKTPTNPTVEN